MSVVTDVIFTDVISFWFMFSTRAFFYAVSFSAKNPNRDKVSENLTSEGKPPNFERTCSNIFWMINSDFLLLVFQNQGKCKDPLEAKLSLFIIKVELINNTVMITFSARRRLFTFGTFSEGAYFFSFLINKQPNDQTKTLIFFYGPNIAKGSQKLFSQMSFHPDSCFVGVHFFNAVCLSKASQLRQIKVSENFTSKVKCTVWTYIN